MRRKEVLIGIKSQLRGRVFKSGGGGEGTDSGPSKFWKYKKTNASFLSEDQETGKRIGLN